MEAYTSFAEVYDTFMDNVPYEECPILIISMVEDVKGRGGSGYVVKKDSLVLEEWFSSH